MGGVRGVSSWRISSDDRDSRADGKDRPSSQGASTRPRARRAVPAGAARHRCRGARVVLPLWGLSAYFLLQKLLYVVYCRKKTLNDGQSRRVNQQSQRILYAGAELNRLYPGYSISMSNHAV